LAQQSEKNQASTDNHFFCHRKDLEWETQDHIQTPNNFQDTYAVSTPQKNITQLS
jgi:hypothetical protein